MQITDYNILSVIKHTRSCITYCLWSNFKSCTFVSTTLIKTFVVEDIKFFNFLNLFYFGFWVSLFFPLLLLREKKEEKKKKPIRVLVRRRARRCDRLQHASTRSIERQPHAGLVVPSGGENGGKEKKKKKEERRRKKKKSFEKNTRIDWFKRIRTAIK